jgi:hypothetical protein
VRIDQLGEAAGCNCSRVGAELLANRGDDPIHLPGEAVHDTRLQRGDRRLADHARRLDEVDLAQARRAVEQRVHRDLDPRRQYPADILSSWGDDVEVRRRPEVDDDARRAVAVCRGHGIRDPVRADLARVVVTHGDPRLDSRP